MIWWLIAIVALVLPTAVAAHWVPPELYSEIFKISLWGASFWTALVGLFSGFMLTHLRGLLEHRTEKGWRERDRRAAVVHQIRMRLAFVIGWSVLLTASLFFLPLLGPRFPPWLQAYAVGVPFGAAGFFSFIIFSILLWLGKISAHERRLLREADQADERSELLGKLRGAKFGKADDKSSVIDGHIVR